MRVAAGQPGTHRGEDVAEVGVAPLGVVHAVGELLAQVQQDEVEQAQAALLHPRQVVLAQQFEDTHGVQRVVQEMVVLDEYLGHTLLGDLGEVQVEPVGAECPPRAVHHRDVAEVAAHVAADGREDLRPGTVLAHPFPRRVVRLLVLAHVQHPEVGQRHHAEPLVQPLPLRQDAHVRRLGGGPHHGEVGPPVGDAGHRVEVTALLGQCLQQRGEGLVGLVDDDVVEGGVRYGVLPVPAGMGSARDRHDRRVDVLDQVGQGARVAPLDRVDALDADDVRLELLDDRA